MSNFWTANALVLILVALFLIVFLLMFIASQLEKKQHKSR